MAYDEGLADRVRDLLAEQTELSERKMFGGLAFLVGGHMAVAVSGQGGLMVRVDPDETEHLLGTTAAFPMEMRGRALKGWLRVDSADVRGERELRTWVGRGASYAGSLPPK